MGKSNPTKINKTNKMSEDKNIVIDNGSGVIKAGFAGENQPSCKFPSILGVPRSDKQMLGVESKSEYIGDEAQKMRGVLNLSQDPISRCSVLSPNPSTSVMRPKK